MKHADLARRVRIQGGTDGRIVTLTPLDPHLNYSRADELKARLRFAADACWADGARVFVLDLARVSVMDSCGMSVLISLRKHVQGLGGELRIASPSPMIERLFVITRLGSVFDVYPSVSEATRGGPSELAVVPAIEETARTSAAPSAEDATS